jgi:hypothetical protein
MVLEAMWARIRKFPFPPLFPEDEEKTRIADLLNAILWSVLFVAVVFGFGGHLQLRGTFSSGTGSDPGSHWHAVAHAQRAGVAGSAILVGFAGCGFD